MTDATDPPATFVPYRSYGEWSRPVVTVEVTYGNAVVPVAMLVDTGSDNIVLPEYLIEALEMSPSDCQAVAAGTVHGLQLGTRCPAVMLSLPDVWPDWRLKARWCSRPV